MYDIQTAWLEIRAITVAGDVHCLARYACGRRRISDNPNRLGL